MARAGDTETGSERTQYLLVHPRILSSKERTPKVRSSLPIIDRWKPPRTLIVSPVPYQGYALLTPTPHRDTCYAATEIVYQGCWAAIVGFHRSLAFRGYEVWSERRREDCKRLEFSHLYHTAVHGTLPQSHTPRVLKLLLLVLR